jgi:hypothetical protein
LGKGKKVRFLKAQLLAAGLLVSANCAQATGYGVLQRTVNACQQPHLTLQEASSALTNVGWSKQSVASMDARQREQQNTLLFLSVAAGMQSTRSIGRMTTRFFSKDEELLRLTISERDKQTSVLPTAIVTCRLFLNGETANEFATNMSTPFVDAAGVLPTRIEMFWQGETKAGYALRLGFSRTPPDGTDQQAQNIINIFLIGIPEGEPK